MKLSELKAEQTEISEINLADYAHVVKNSGTTSEWVSYAKIGAGTGVATAYAGGGQVNATELTKYETLINVCASDYDSVKPVINALKDYRFKVRNYTSKIVHLYPKSGDNFEGKAANHPIEIAAGAIVEFVCFVNGEWTL